MRLFIASTGCLLFVLALNACEQNSGCQSGPKYGTQCYGPVQQPAYSSNGQQGSASQTTQPSTQPTTVMPSTPSR